jgi:ABC-type branched-subunit amino acid transport system substrate-binding protein
MTDLRRTSRTPRIALALALLFVLSSCAGPFGFGTRVPDEERQAFEVARSNLPDDPAAAEAAFKAFLAAYPESGLADDACEELARIAFTEGRVDDAFLWLYNIVENYPDSDRIDSVRLRLARWEERRGNRAEARVLVDRVRDNRLEAADRRALYRLLAALTDDPVAKVAHLSKLRRLAEIDYEAEATILLDSATTLKLRENLEAIETQIDRLLLEMTDDELRRVAASRRGQIPGPRAKLLLARRALDGGNYELAESLIAQARRGQLSSADEERLGSLELRLGMGDLGERLLPTFREAAARELPSTEGVGGTIGIVLPLSGRFASFGQEALRGVLLAARVFDRPAPSGSDVPGAGTPPVSAGPGGGEGVIDEITEPEIFEVANGIRLVVRDTRGRPDTAAAAVRELAADRDVLAVIGPIFSEESEAAAREAESQKIPLITLSNREEISAERDQVFRVRTTPDDEVGFLVDYAIDQLGAKQFAVLYPKSRYGRGMRTRYWDAVSARGGSVVAVGSYEPDATDFTDPIRGMIGYELLTSNERIALQERDQAMRRGRRLEPEHAAMLREVLYTMMGPEGEPLPPQVDFDALFIPDAHDKVELIAPQLAYHEIAGVRLLGSSEWNHPDLVRIGRAHVRGAVISTSFHPESELGHVREFVTAYRDSFETEPDEFSSNAYDAANLVLIQLAFGRDSRSEVRDGILRVHGYPGVSGVTTIMPDGNARKRPFLLGVKRGSIVGLD